MHTFKNIVWDYQNGDGGFLVIKNVVTIEFDEETNVPRFESEVTPHVFGQGPISVFSTEREAALRCFFQVVQDDAMLAEDWCEMVRGWGIDVSAENWRQQLDACRPNGEILSDLKITRVLFRACLGQRARAFLEAEPDTPGVWRKRP